MATPWVCVIGLFVPVVGSPSLDEFGSGAVRLSGGSRHFSRRLEIDAHGSLKMQELKSDRMESPMTERDTREPRAHTPASTIASVMRAESGQRSDTAWRPFAALFTAPTSFSEEASSASPSPAQSVKSSLSCGVTTYAPDVSMDATCPDNCHFWSADASMNNFCYFQCVPPSDCGKLDPNATVADEKQNLCRPCAVTGCAECRPNAGDNCAVCSSGYVAYGAMCRPSQWYLKSCVLGSLGIAFIIFLIWFISLLRRPIVNEVGLSQGLISRGRTELHMPIEAQSAEPAEGEMAIGRVKSVAQRQLWPLNTNLLKVEVAGPGTVLFFNFQALWMLWAFLVALLWGVFALAKNVDLFKLGLQPFSTPREQCSVVVWGYQTQQNLLPTKLWFLLSIYLFTTMFAILSSIYLLRLFHILDDSTTMRDYAALCTGLPEFLGSEHVEEKLKIDFEELTKQRVVGVSCCWNFAAHEATVRDALEQDTDAKQAKRASAAHHVEGAVEDDEDVEPSPGVVSRACDKVDTMMLSILGAGETPEIVSDERITLLLENLKTCDSAFIVFETEAARDAAVLMSAGGLSLSGSALQLSKVDSEPEGVRWETFNAGTPEVIKKLAVGVLLILCALAVWSLCVYLPYAYYVTSVDYSHGEKPGGATFMFFTMLVVAGNLIMYCICAYVAMRTPFHFVDNCETAYLILYLMACVFNVLCDLVITYSMSYRMMKGLGIHTYHGKAMEDLDGFLEIFTSYPIQKAMGKQLFLYSFPSCFLLPFIAEPMGTILIPYHIAKLLVRSRKEIRGRRAENALQFFIPMDLSRYGDLLLNIVLSCLIFLFPSGYTLPMFLCLLLSHVYIFALDQKRVLRHVPSFVISSNVTLRHVEALLAFPCAILLAIFVFKSNELRSSPANGSALFWMCFGALVAHVLLHWFLLFFVVPLFGRKHHESESAYAQTANRIACTWFSSNPVHCLRSAHIYRHSPHCAFFVKGKEHLLVANPEIGVYYETEAARVSVNTGGGISDSVQSLLK